MMKNRFSRFTALVLTLLILLSVVGCTKKSATEVTPEAESSEPSVEPEVTPEETSAPVETPLGFAVEKDGVTSYTDALGNPVNGWKKGGAGAWYYLDENGVPVTGTQILEGKTSVFDEEGVLVSGWLISDEGTFYLAADGSMVTGWVEDEGRRYYFRQAADEDQGTLMKDCWLIVDQGLYHLDASGAMTTDGVSPVTGNTLPYVSTGALDVNTLDTETIETILDTAVFGMDKDQMGIRDLDPNKPMIALTYDDGPGKATSTILDALEEVGGRATFFVVGSRVEKNTDLLERMVEMGCDIGIHTWNHPNLNECDESTIREELVNTRDAVEAATGYTPHLMRPPYGKNNNTVRNICCELGLPLITWNIDTLDWSTKDADSTYNTTMNEAQDGYIVLCHDIYEPTGQANARMIPALVERGYQLVTITELLYYRRHGALGGRNYSHGNAAAVQS